MNGFLNRLLFNIATLDIFRRRYFIYKDMKLNLYYVKTKKLFFKSKYININERGYIIKAYRKKLAIKRCPHSTIDLAMRTMAYYDNNYSIKPKLRYIRISI